MAETKKTPKAHEPKPQSSLQTSESSQPLEQKGLTFINDSVQQGYELFIQQRHYEAIPYLETAARDNDFPALVLLGLIYWNPIYLQDINEESTKRYENALKYSKLADNVFKKFKEQNEHNFAYFNYFRGFYNELIAGIKIEGSNPSRSSKIIIATDKTIEEGQDLTIDCYRQASELDDAALRMNLFILFSKSEKEQSEALKWLTKMANSKKRTDCCSFFLGAFYEARINMPGDNNKNIFLALQWYVRSAAQHTKDSPADTAILRILKNKSESVSNLFDFVSEQFTKENKPKAIRRISNKLVYGENVKDHKLEEKTIVHNTKNKKTSNRVAAKATIPKTQDNNTVVVHTTSSSSSQSQPAKKPNSISQWFKGLFRQKKEVDSRGHFHRTHYSDQEEDASVFKTSAPAKPPKEQKQNPKVKYAKISAESSLLRADNRSETPPSLFFTNLKEGSAAKPEALEDEEQQDNPYKLLE